MAADKKPCIIRAALPAMTMMPDPAEMAITLVASARASSWGGSWPTCWAARS